MSKNKGLKLKTTGRRQVEEAPYGTYVFRCTDGSYMGDGEGRLMCIFGFKNDPEKVKKMWDAARHYDKDAAHGGEVEFWSGQRPVTDEQYDEQVARSKMGLTPDPLDYGAIMDGLRSKKHYG